jgi:NAD(P)-dependent dehydrogenase (short-subunit alcohol dehydrogenase family)
MSGSATDGGTGRVALVTGGSRGIGREAAVRGSKPSLAGRLVQPSADCGTSANGDERPRSALSAIKV